ncbi:hypothetical protein Tco_0190470 [Tanacetum coccineum]
MVVAPDHGVGGRDEHGARVVEGEWPNGAETDGGVGSALEEVGVGDRIDPGDVKRDPLTSDDVVDLPLMDKLNENCHDKDDMGLLDFVKSVDPLNVKVGERTLAEGEVPLLTETANMVVEPSSQTARLVSHTIVDKLKKSTRKRKGKLVSVLFVSFSDTLTPKRDCQDESVYVHDENVRTLPASDGFVVLTSSSEPADTDTLTSSQVASPTLHVQSETEAVAIGLVNEARSSYTIDSATAHEIYVPNWDVTNDARMDDLIMCRNLIDHVPPPGYWASLYHNKGKVREAKSGDVERWHTQAVQNLCKTNLNMKWVEQT